MYTPQEFQILIAAVDKLSQEELCDSLKCLNFEKILNVSILDFETIRLTIEFLTKLSKLDILYKYACEVELCWEFTLTNLLALEKVPAEDILLKLLQLLQSLIPKMKPPFKEYLQLVKESERIVNILTLVSKFKIFNKVHVPVFTDVIRELLQIQGPFLGISKNLAEIAEVYKDLQVVHELVFFCDISLNLCALSVELSEVCWPWLLLNGPGLLTEVVEEHTLLLLLKVVTELYTRCKYVESNKDQKLPSPNDFESFKLNLRQVSHCILNLSARSNLRDASLKLLSVLLSEYVSEELKIDETPTAIFSKLLQLPLDVQQWPCVKSEMFFYVCSFLCMYTRSCWNSAQVIESMSRLIYSYDRFTIHIPLLKSLCYTYPIIIVDHVNVNNVLLGDELLIILSKFPYSLPKIISYHVAQLVWVLQRGCALVKKSVLTQWLNRDEDLDVLGRAIVECRAGNVLLDILLEWKFDESASDKAIQMCHRIEYKELSKNIACLIPTKLRSQPLLSRLILSNPGVPDNTEAALKICEFMSLVLCLIHDQDVLKAACLYINKLVKSLKRESNVVDLFCYNINNMRFLAIKNKYVREDVAVEILRLFKVLILVQKRNHNVLECKVEADLSPSLVGSMDKIDKCLDLLYVITTFRDVFVILPNSSVLNIFMNLFHMSQESNLAVRSFACLTGILRNNPWLAQIPSTGLFIEIQCSLAVDQKSAPEFLRFLASWLQIFSKSWTNTACQVDKRVVSNYLKRCGCVSQNKLDYLLELLRKLNTFPENCLADGYQDKESMQKWLF